MTLAVFDMYLTSQNQGNELLVGVRIQTSDLKTNEKKNATIRYMPGVLKLTLMWIVHLETKYDVLYRL